MSNSFNSIIFQFQTNFVSTMASRVVYVDHKNDARFFRQFNLFCLESDDRTYSGKYFWLNLQLFGKAFRTNDCVSVTKL
jgi:hypothetical protein